MVLTSWYFFTDSELLEIILNADAQWLDETFRHTGEDPAFPLDHEEVPAYLAALKVLATTPGRDLPDDLLADELAAQLTKVANYPSPAYTFRPVKGPDREMVGSDEYRESEQLLVGASRALGRILNGGYWRALRCVAPAKKTGGQVCGRWMVIGHARGKPRKFCSDACRVRAQRRPVLV